MDLDQLKQILDLVREHELTEFEVEHDGLRLKVRKDAAGGLVTSMPAPVVHTPVAAPPVAAVTTVGSGGTVAPAPPATPIPAVYAVPGQFGSLAATPLVIGAPDPETGNRFVLNLETPSLNTYVYEYITDCPA